MFGKKKGPGGSPVDQINQLRQQGTPNDQIIQQLQSQGYASADIFSAMNQLDQQQGAPPDQGGMPPPGQGQDPSYGQDQPMGADPYGGGGDGGYAPAEGSEQIEEIAEAIIDEKWNDFLKNINKISEWNHKTESRLTKIEADITNLKENFESLHKGILGKISEYDRNLVNVGTEIKAMEKVFQKILPTFTDNVNKLSRVTQNLPDEKKKPSSNG